MNDDYWTDSEPAQRRRLTHLPHPAKRIRSWPPHGPLQRVGSESSDAGALTIGFSQLSGHHVGGAQRVPAFAQNLGDQGRTAKIDFKRPGEVKFPLRRLTGPCVPAS
jgi:hypothetical protein